MALASPPRGFVTSYQQSRLNWITGTSFPACPAGTFLALYTVMPAADGTGGTEAVSTRPAITLGAPQTDGDGRQYITNASGVNATINSGLNGSIIGYGICAANSGGTPVYIDVLYPFQVSSGQAITIAANAVKVFSEFPR